MALDLATELLEEDDENIEVWYIAGVAALSKVPADVDTARYHFSTALEMMNTIKKICAEEREVCEWNK